MTIQSMAVNAANTLRGRAAYGSDPEFIALASRQQRIVARFNLVFIPDRGAYCAEEDSTRVNGTLCHIDDIETCEHCEESCSERYEVQYRARHTNNPVSEAWCSDCRSESAFYCEGCDESFADDEQRIFDGTSFCQNCYDGLERDCVPSYHSAKRWIPPYASCFSFELELEAEERGDLVKLLETKQYDKVSWEKDGSLSDIKGLEILIQLRPTLVVLANDTCALVRAIKGKGLGLRSWEGSKCGLHLNSSTYGWSVHQLMRLVWIVRSAKDLLISISGRESMQWASFTYNGYTLRDEAYCKAGKYRALRIGTDRMEWRMFRGTLSEKRIKLYCDTAGVLEVLAQSDIPAHHLRAKANSTLTQLLNSFNNL